MSYGIIEPEAFTSMMALLQITSAEEAEGKFEDTPLQTAFEVEVLSYEDQDEDIDIDLTDDDWRKIAGIIQGGRTSQRRG
jgi:hypothetical protein